MAPLTASTLYTHEATPWRCTSIAAPVHRFLLSKSKFSTIDVPGAVYTDASGINPQGDIVGSSLRAAASATVFC